MKTKIVYVLVSSPTDIYLEQAYISMASVRYHMPDAHISLIVDNQTKESFNNKRQEMIKEVNELITVEITGNYTSQQRSRVLKTSARKYIKGDFLFIDCDTIILSKFDEIDNWNFELGACRDSHSEFNRNPYRNMCIRDCKRLGYDITNEQLYFNSGVLYVKDTPKTAIFYERWNSNWLKGIEKGVNMDQPSFAITNIQNGYIIRNLSDEWNCQIVHGIKFLPKAYILHYLCTNSNHTGDIFVLRGREVFNQIKVTGEIPEIVCQCFVDPFLGIPPMTQLQGGTLINIFSTSSWNVLKIIYKSNKIFQLFDSMNWCAEKLAIWYKRLFS